MRTLPSGKFFGGRFFTPRRLRLAGIGLVIGLVVGAFLYSHFFGPTLDYAKAEQFIVEPGQTNAQVAAELKEQGYVQSTWLTRAVLRGARPEGIGPGGYTIGKHMDLWVIAETLAARPGLVFVTIPPRVRKEEIGEILARELFWDETQKAAWKTTTEVDADLAEGVYYPDTYLIPTDQEPPAIAARLRGRFADVFAPYAEEARQKGMDWNDVLTLASLVDREASPYDRELVAGILWNRVDRGMKLQVDATLQYARGRTGEWWPVPQSEDKYINSPFNTYKHAGLPPHPINNPSVASVEAALNPERTNCLFYIHSDQQIHCSDTYDGQRANVDTYLR
ncbi:MAG TPA: endolytic transglycosylase MltG [Candidatus Paceibacterota bacterium]|jgi:UPF0755 protein